MSFALVLDVLSKESHVSYHFQQNNTKSNRKIAHIAQLAIATFKNSKTVRRELGFGQVPRSIRDNDIEIQVTVGSVGTVGKRAKQIYANRGELLVKLLYHCFDFLLHYFTP